jgi:hypothetical protein
VTRYAAEYKPDSQPLVSSFAGSEPSMPVLLGSLGSFGEGPQARASAAKVSRDGTSLLVYVASRFEDINLKPLVSTDSIVRRGELAINYTCSDVGELVNVGYIWAIPLLSGVE